MSLTFVQGDTAPDIESVLHEEDIATNLLDLTSATAVRFQMRRENDHRFTINAVASIVDAEKGKVKYAWGVNDLAVPGVYQFQWEVTWAGGKVQTTAPTETLTVRRQ